MSACGRIWGILESEPLGGAEGMPEAVSFKKAMESVRRRRIMSARREWVADCRSCNAKTTRGTDSLCGKCDDCEMMN